MNQKRGLYEQFLLREISVDGYKLQKAVADKELEWLKQIHAALAKQTAQMQLEIYAKEHGFEIVGSSSDMGNGLTLDRPGLLGFHAAVENGKVDILLIANLSRLGRDTDRETEYWQMLRDLGVSVHTADWGEVALSLCTILLGMSA